MRSIGSGSGTDGDGLTALLLKQAVRQAKCNSTGHRKKKRQKQASHSTALRAER
jgi:hypothetical protein